MKLTIRLNGLNRIPLYMICTEEYRGPFPDSERLRAYPRRPLIIWYSFETAYLRRNARFEGEIY
jgi:hypothetical protein